MSVKLETNMNEYDSQKICNATIRYGKNSGKLCARIGCDIIGHDKFAQGKGKCRSVIRVGRNKGLQCGRINCAMHYNIADLLELPQYFRESVEHDRKFFTRELWKSMINYYNSCEDVASTFDKLKFLEYMKLSENLYNKSKEVMIIYYFHIIDIEKARAYLYQNSTKFYKIVNFKLGQFSMYEHCPDFRDYMKNTFEPGEMYLSIQKNMKHKSTLAKSKSKTSPKPPCQDLEVKKEIEHKLDIVEPFVPVQNMLNVQQQTDVPNCGINDVNLLVFYFLLVGIGYVLLFLE